MECPRQRTRVRYNVGVKKCAKCRLVLPLSEFHHPPSKQGRPASKCKPCVALVLKEWRKANPERTAEQRRRYNSSDIGRARNKERSALRREEKPDAVREYRRQLYESRQRETNAQSVREYRRANPGKHSEIENRRRARKMAAFVAPVDTDAIYARDGGICQLCGTPVQRTAATLDHIVPLSRGGTHEPANVQIAHGPCNSRKGNRYWAAG